MRATAEGDSTVRRRYPLSWELARGRRETIDAADWIPAIVPGSVQLDWARAHDLPDFTVGENVMCWRGLEESFWTYRTRVELPVFTEGEKPWLVLQGIDYAARVFVDGKEVASHEGMETPLEVPLTGGAEDGIVIEVELAPAPKSHAHPADRSQADHTCKPAVAYGWDFHPRLIPLGLWKETFLEVRPRCYLERRPELNYTLSEDLRRAEGGLRIYLPAGEEGESVVVCWSLRDEAGETRAAATAEVALRGTPSEVRLPFELDLEESELWWPRGQGRATLFVSRVELLSGAPSGEIREVDSRRVGFRRVRLVMAPGEWNSPATFPKSRSRPPMTLEINGRPIFAKGSNWVCPDVFPSRVSRKRYDALLELAAECHFNILRVWGGASAPHDHFYERCDELGLMVWQEFPLACNGYPDDAAYLDLLDQESKSLIQRLRLHPSLVLWCGGNELFNSWSRMTDQSLPLRLLNRNTYELDPSRPFLPTAPVYGMGHGHYTFLDPVEKVEAWAVFQDSTCTAYSEFGCPGPAPLESLRSILPEAEQWPPRPSGTWKLHHAFDAWLPGSWLHLREQEHYFGPCESLESLVKRGQFLQAIGFQGIFEEARRQRPTASMALNWCFAEPWPAIANNSLVAWPCLPKPALRAVTAACRPTLASARIRRFSWEPGSLFEAELWFLHEGRQVLEGVKVEAWIEFGEEGRHLVAWKISKVAPDTNVLGPTVRTRLPDRRCPFRLLLTVSGKPEWDSGYELQVGPTAESFHEDIDFTRMQRRLNF